jgi:arylsulfatase A-like enzyme
MPTPRIDRLAAEGMRLNQFLVEAGCTPSRAALVMGRYSIRAGLSLITFPGSNELLNHEFTIGDLFKSAGYRTVYYGKWHLGVSTETEPQYRGFDEWRLGFYGSSDGTLYGDNISRSHGPPALLAAKPSRSARPTPPARPPASCSRTTWPTGAASTTT